KDGEDNARLTDLLTNGSSPFDSSIPSDVFIPQRGGSLFFSDADIQAFIAEVYAQAGVGGQEIPAAETDSPADETGNDNQALYEAFCTVDEASQKACDFLVQLAKDG